MSRKQRIIEQIKNLRSLISDLEHSLLELEDVGKTSESDDILRRIKELEKSGGPYPVPQKYPQKGWTCASCGHFVSSSEWHMCSGKQYPYNYNIWICQCGASVGTSQVHTCQWNPGINF